MRPHHLIAFIDDEQVRLPLVTSQCPVGHQQGTVGLAYGNAHPHEQAGGQNSFLVGEDPADVEGSRARAYLIAGVVDGTLVGVVLLTDQARRYRIGRVAVRLGLALADEALDVQHGRHVHVEVDVDRVLRDDGGQLRLIGDHQIPLGDQVDSGFASDRGGNTGPLEVLLGGAEGSLGTGDVGPRLTRDDASF